MVNADLFAPLYPVPVDSVQAASRMRAADADPLPVLRPIPQRPEQMADALITATAWGMVDDVEAMLTAGADPNARPDQEAALHMAVWRDRPAVVRVLLAHGADPDIIEDDGGWTGWAPLHIAVKCDDIETVRALLEGGADPSVRSVSEYGGRDLTPLHIAAGRNFVDAVRALIDAGADVNAAAVRYNNGVTPLHFAAGAGSVDSVRLLIEAGAALDTPNTEGCTASDLAKAINHAETVRILTEAETEARAGT